ncbi:MAG: hypothetical protein E6Q78_05280 [Rhodoferax sp.]|nr:MAG: hypothetical protein E6Q78_05280 [Rhodoferax sp.]
MAAHIAAGAAPHQEAWLWPCNQEAWGYWLGVQTQWNVGASGATGLRYEGVRAYLDEVGLQGELRQQVWAAVCACERATLQAWGELRDQQAH